MIANKKFNSQKLLSQLATAKSSGCLELNNGEIYFQIYLQQGNLKYINCSVQPPEQLDYYLHSLQLPQAVLPLKQWVASYLAQKSALDGQKTNSDIYSEAISWLVEKQYLTQSETTKLIQHLTKEALQYCVWLDRGVHNWREAACLPQTSLENSPPLNLLRCLSWEKTRLKQWQSCSAKLSSVHQRPYLISNWEKETLPSAGSLDIKVLEQLAKIMTGRTSVRQLSLLLKQDEIDVARILSPYIDRNIIYLRNAKPTLRQLPTIPRLTNADNDQKPNSIVKSRKILCIDDSPTILSEIQRFLTGEMFEVIVIDEPTQAPAKVFSTEPDLILLDVNMPKINGYELCKLLKKSGKCDNTPIIMVTGNRGIIDKAKAKIVGASDYLTKPFTQSALIKLVNKHLN